MTKGIVFDLDETLVDRKGSLDEYASVLFDFFRSECKFEENEFAKTFHELDGNGRVSRSDFFARLSHAAFEKVLPEQIAEHFYANAWVKPILFDGVIETLDHFKASAYPVGIVTNGSGRTQNAKISNSGLSRHVDACVISEEFGAKKPDPSIYAEITRRLDIKAHDSWFIGDDPLADVIGPTDFGFNTVWLERHTPWPEGENRCYRHHRSQVAELKELLF